MGKIIGIDLGTTYSCACYMDGGGFLRAIETEEGSYVTPSVVCFEPDGGQVVVGWEAKIEGSLYPERTTLFPKNYLGVPDYAYFFDEQPVTPTNIATLILQKLINDAEMLLGCEDIDGVVVACPSYFGALEHKELITACENVTMSNGRKLNSVRILIESVAAGFAYAYATQCDVQKNILLYDLGGSSFDAAVLNVDFSNGKKECKIITSNGDFLLGGIEWDHALEEHLKTEFSEQTGVDLDDLYSDSDQYWWYREYAEKTKKALSSRQQQVLYPRYKEYKASIEISRNTFDEITEHLLERTVLLINEMMDSSGLTIKDDIAEIVLIGGASKMPQVERILREKFDKPITLLDPEMAIARGAALVAGWRLNADNDTENS
ncbi:MAG: Hsp70 family protein [Clostridia bacterium]|nr:Hsp70 family protein [Clostridia bacterium]